MKIDKPFRLLVIGYGVQGEKRARIAGEDLAGIVDPVRAEATYQDIAEVPLAEVDAAILCTPDRPKMALLNRLIDAGIHCLVEKPLWAAEDVEIQAVADAAQRKGVFVATAYNHRFEPHFAAMRALIDSESLGRIYRCRMFYGNGTARLVRNSEWRDQGSGVLHDLGSHLLDTASFWFGELGGDWRVASADCFENRAPDHVVLENTASEPRLQLEMTLLSWRNHFTADLYAERGSAHIQSLCKWGPSSLTVRRRILPAGRPPEEEKVLIQEDPTWALEYEWFKQRCRSGARADLSQDLRLNAILRDLGARAIEQATGGG
ncbi:MAG: Gfo/Idh/MocA family oxidoreductase [Neomegalonema sp.]|nr:Gfo/Idh/MocA family oxidoreductase [Neomegalonema sp.]